MMTFNLKPELNRIASGIVLTTALILLRAYLLAHLGQINLYEIATTILLGFAAGDSVRQTLISWESALRFRVNIHHARKVEKEIKPIPRSPRQALINTSHRIADCKNNPELAFKLSGDIMQQTTPGIQLEQFYVHVERVILTAILLHVSETVEAATIETARNLMEECSDSDIKEIMKASPSINTRQAWTIANNCSAETMRSILTSIRYNLSCAPKPEITGGQELLAVS